METLGRAAQYLASPFEYSYDSGPRVYVNGFATREGKVASMHGLKTGIVFQIEFEQQRWLSKPVPDRDVIRQNNGEGGYSCK